MRKAVKFNCRLLPAEKTKYLKEVFMALVVRWTTRRREIDKPMTRAKYLFLAVFTSHYTSAMVLGLPNDSAGGIALLLLI